MKTVYPARAHARRARIALLALFTAAVCLCAPARAQIAPNPGGTVVETNSTTASISYVDTPVTDRVDDYSTTLTALVDGNPVFSQTFLLPFTDPTVQTAVTDANAILSGDGASFGSPSLISSNSVLQSSVTPPLPPPDTCLTVPAGDFTGGTSVTTTTTFGPATILVGDCQSDTFTVLAGQEDININTESDYSVPVDVVTTDTYLDTQTFEIVGTTVGASVPEPGSLAVLIVGLGALAVGRYRPSTRKLLGTCALIAASLSLCAPAGAGIAPNPGGPIVVTNSTTASVSYVDTPVTDRVDDYVTTLTALVDGSQVFSQTYLLPFTDPTVQTAVTDADAILSGDGASFGSPSLISSNSVLQSSVTPPLPPPATCLEAEAIGPASVGSTVTSTTTTTTTFGPATIGVGDCLGDTFTVLVGQEDININTDNDWSIPLSIVTTDTYLDTQTFEIVGTTAGVSVPEPASLGIALLGLGAMGCWRRRRVGRSKP